MVTGVGRVRRLTVQGLNTTLQLEAEARVAYYANHPEQIQQRLQELDEEWDIERAIEVEAAGTVLCGFLLGITVSKKWFLLPFVAGGMLLLHNLQGGYPLLPLFRRVGLRTSHEIDQERYALKALREDFEPVAKTQAQKRAQVAFDAASPS